MYPLWFEDWQNWSCARQIVFICLAAESFDCEIFFHLLLDLFMSWFWLRKSIYFASFYFEKVKT